MAHRRKPRTKLSPSLSRTLTLALIVTFHILLLAALTFASLSAVTNANGTCTDLEIEGKEGCEGLGRRTLEDLDNGTGTDTCRGIESEQMGTLITNMKVAGCVGKGF